MALLYCLHISSLFSLNTFHFTFLVPDDIFLYTVWSPLIQQIIGENLHMLSGIQAPVNMDVSHGVYISVGAPVSSVHI